MRFAPVLPHWFDLVALAMLAIGIWTGRKRGMSDEVLRLAQWIIMLFVGARFYHPLGMKFAHWAKIQPNTAFVLVYLTLVFTTHVIFSNLRRLVGEKLVDRDFFGGWEYYLGMVAGMVRHACILLMGLALLSAAYVTEKELQDMAKYQRENFGSISFLTLGDLQRQVFYQSKTGKIVKINLHEALIVSVPPVHYPPEKHKGLGSRFGDGVNEAFEAPRAPAKENKN